MTLTPALIVVPKSGAEKFLIQSPNVTIVYPADSQQGKEITYGGKGVVNMYIPLVLDGHAAD